MPTDPVQSTLAGENVPECQATFLRGLNILSTLFEGTYIHDETVSSWEVSRVVFEELVGSRYLAQKSADIHP